VLSLTPHVKVLLVLEHIWNIIIFDAYGLYCLHFCFSIGIFHYLPNMFA